MENKHIIYILFSIIILLVLLLIFKKYFNYTLNIDLKNNNETFDSYLNRKKYKKEHFENNNEEEIYKKVKEMIDDNNITILDEIKNIKCDCKCNNKKDEIYNKDENDKEEKEVKENKLDEIIKEKKERRKIHSDIMINTLTGKRKNNKNKLLIDSLIFDENIPEAYYHYYYKPESNKNDIKLGYNYNEFITKQKPFDMSNDDLSNDIIDKKDEIEGSNEIDIFDED